jgi:hypothetical protein
MRHFYLRLVCAALQGHLCLHRSRLCSRFLLRRSRLCSCFLLRRSRLCCNRFLFRRDLPGVIVNATNMLIVKSSQHAAIGHRRSKTYGSLGAHDFDQCGLDDGSEPRGKILSAPGLGSTAPLNTSERSRSTVLHLGLLLHVLDLFHFSYFISLFLLYSLF